MNKVLVVIIASDLSAGGGGRETWLKNFLDSSNIKLQYDELHIICYGMKKADCLSFDKKVIVHWNKKCGKLPLFRFLFHVKNTLNLIYNKSNDFKVIACGSWFELLALSFSSIKNKSNVVTICWLRSIVIKELSRYYSTLLLPICKMIEHNLLKKMDFIISNGFDTKAHYLDQGIDSIVIPNSIQVNKFEINNVESPIILYCGRLSVEKGIREFVSTISTLLASRYDFEVIIIGSGRDELLKPIIDHDKVHYLGQLSGDNLLSQISKASISAHLTLSGELGGGGISHSLLESMCLGQMIVCWDSKIFTQVHGSDQFFMAKEGELTNLVMKMNDAIDLVLSSEYQNSRILMNHSGNIYNFDEHVNLYLKIIEHV